MDDTQVRTASTGYRMFHDEQNEVTRIVLKPGLALAA